MRNLGSFLASFFPIVLFWNCFQLFAFRSKAFDPPTFLRRVLPPELALSVSLLATVAGRLWLAGPEIICGAFAVGRGAAGAGTVSALRFRSLNFRIGRGALELSLHYTYYLHKSSSINPPTSWE